MGWSGSEGISSAASLGSSMASSSSKASSASSVVCDDAMLMPKRCDG